MQDIRLNKVGNEFRSIKARAVAARALAVDVTERIVEAGGKVVEAVEPMLPQSPRRRAVLKYSLFGGAAFMLGKVLGPSITIAPQSIDISDKNKEYLFENFRVVEKDGQLGFYDKLGNEILVLEKDGEV